MSPPIKQVTFAGGEISPASYARTDIARYENSLRTMRNFFAMRHGGATQRPGTMYVATTLNGGSPVRLIPFIFNETGNGQSYVLEFGNQYIAFYQNGGVVVSGGNPYKISSPYLQADLATLDFRESADVVTITHPNYAPMNLKRIAATNWTLTTIVFGPTIGTPASIGINGLPGTSTLVYYVTALNAAGEEGVFQQQTTPNLTIPTTTNIATAITVTWVAVPNATGYVIYSVLNGVPGRIGQAGAGATSFLDYGYTPDFTNQPPNNNTPFSGAGNFPSITGFVQQRQAFANTNNNPLGFWLSIPGVYANLTTHNIVRASDAIIGSLAGEEVNAIRAIMELKFMLMLTTGAEFFVQGDGTGIVTPASINASVQSQYGCSTLRPLKVGDVLLFNQALGSFIRDFSFDFAIDGYRGNDITIFASHLFEGYSLSDWAYQKIPDSIIWAVRSDGILLSCTYVREQQVLAWAHHDFTNGTVQNVCAIPENGQYALYLTIQRVINGQTVVYMERMSSRIWLDEINATYLDCYSTYNGTNTGSTTMTLLSPVGGFTTDGTAYQQQITLQASAGYFTAAMVGDQIVLSDAAYISSIGSQTPDGSLAALGPKGNQVRCTIQAYTSATQVTITPSGAVPTSLQNLPITTWARAVKTVTGLGYLAGQSVSIWADRFVVASPNNTINRTPTTYVVPVSGILTLDKWYAVIYVGLPMTADSQTLDIDTSWGETEMAKRKRMARLNIHVYNTRSLFVGSENPDINNTNATSDPLWQMNELLRGENTRQYIDPPELITDQDYVLVDTRWNKNGRLFIRNVDPVPCTILAISPQGEDPVPQAWGKKV